MITGEQVCAFDKSDLRELAKTIPAENLPELVGFLSAKDDDLRYKSLLLLQYRSDVMGDVYPFWDKFRIKLKSDNSYQRSIGLLLLAANTKWDADNKMDSAIEDCLSLLKDDKPVTVRQCIQSLPLIYPYKPQLHHKIAHALIDLDLSLIRETMRKLVLYDICIVLADLQKTLGSDRVELYLADALTGGILDRKSIREIEAKIERGI